MKGIQGVALLFFMQGTRSNNGKVFFYSRRFLIVEVSHALGKEILFLISEGFFITEFVVSDVLL